MTLRCVIDGQLLHAELRPESPPVVAYDGDEAFGLEAVEAVYYELVAAKHRLTVTPETPPWTPLLPRHAGRS